MNGLVISTFKFHTRGCSGCGDRGGQDESEFGGACSDCGGNGGCSGVFPVIFVLYANDLLCQTLSLTLSTWSL